MTPSQPLATTSWLLVLCCRFVCFSYFMWDPTNTVALVSDFYLAQCCRGSSVMWCALPCRVNMHSGLLISQLGLRAFCCFVCLFVFLLLLLWIMLLRMCTDTCELFSWQCLGIELFGHKITSFNLMRNCQTCSKELATLFLSNVELPFFHFYRHLLLFFYFLNNYFYGCETMSQ